MLMIEAAADGLGIAYVPETAARLQLQAGRLIALLEDWSPAVGGLRLHYRVIVMCPPRCRLYRRDERCTLARPDDRISVVVMPDSASLSRAGAGMRARKRRGRRGGHSAQIGGDPSRVYDGHL